MKRSSPGSDSKRLKVAMFTDVNDIAIPLAKELRRNYCIVDVISDKKEIWLGEIKGQETKFINFESYSKKIFKSKYDYVIWISLYQRLKRLKTKRIKNRLNFALKLVRLNQAKPLFIFPYIYKESLKREIESLKSIIKKDVSTATILSIGQIIGLEMDLSKDDPLAQTFREVITNGLVKIPKKEFELFPIEIGTATERIVKSLFSFGIASKEAAIVSKPISTSSLIRIFGKEGSKVKVTYFQKTLLYHKVKTRSKIILKQDTEKVIREIYQAFSLEKEAEVSQKGKSIRDTISKKVAIFGTSKKRRAIARLVYKAVAVFLLIVLLPTLTLFLGLLSNTLATKRLESEDYTLARGAFRVSHVSAMITNNLAKPFQKIPGFNKLVSKQQSISKILVKISDLRIRNIKVMNDLIGLTDEMVKDKPFDVSSHSVKFRLEADYIYKETGFVLGEIGSLDPPIQQFLSRVLDIRNLVRSRETMVYAKEVAEQLPDILGENEPRVYLVLLQNNLNLRPTGGLISSLAFLTIDEGRIIDIDIQNVEFADSLLKGYIEPPPPLKRYLGENNWSLENSNWDPDFPTSAEKAEWFVDKEVDKVVDGVIAFDFEFIKEVLEKSGPLYINDTNQELRADNLYDYIIQQKEDEKYADVILKNFLNNIFNLARVNKALILNTYRESIEEKHLQMFSHNKSVQRVLSELGWDGGVLAKKCLGNCYADWFGIVEANLGDTFNVSTLQQNSELKVTFEEGIIKRNLLLTIKNLSGDGENTNSQYSSYIRIITPRDSSIAPITVSQEGRKEDVLPEIAEIRGYKEAGLFVELNPREAKSLLFSWESPSNLDFKNQGEYLLFWRKQAGTINQPVKMTINFPEGVELDNIGDFNLTGGRRLDYNTELSRDFTSRISW